MAFGKKTGGRKPGAKNKKTLQLEALMQSAQTKMQELIGDEAFDGNALAFLATIYKNGKLPLDIRLDAAGKAARFESAVLAPVDGKGNTVPNYVAYLPRQCETAEEWSAEFEHLKSETAPKPSH